MKLEAVQVERAKLVTPDVGSREQELDEASSTALERFQVIKKLEAKVAKFKVLDKHID